jgi:4-amino-4-deoxy-L-arabinose transferase-like glycosyltransferase
MISMGSGLENLVLNFSNRRPKNFGSKTGSCRPDTWLLIIATVICVVPFSGTAFRIDEPLFIWAARQIVSHPLDPYGFRLIWYTSEMPMSEVTKNPPLASYYIAVAGSLVGWSETALHLSFLLPALGVVLGTYRLARRFTRSPLLAAAATLLTPGFLVSAGTVMCDTMMLAFWVLAAILWMEGLDSAKPLYLGASGLLMAATALTKYFGASLILLLLIYSLARKRRLGKWAWYLLIPIITLAAYQFWTHAIYGRGLLMDAAAYATFTEGTEAVSKLAKALVGIGFVGGCIMPGLTFAPLLWSRKQLFIGFILGAVAALTVGTGWMNSGALVMHDHWMLISMQLALCIAGGGSVVALAAEDIRKRRDPDAVFLALWVFGTLIFASFLNWTINARSVLPLIPAAGILLARRMDSLAPTSSRPPAIRAAMALAASGLLSLGVVWADAALANSARSAATLILEKTKNETRGVWFQGHWGFQYYMERLGAQPYDLERSDLHAGDVVVVPENNTNASRLEPERVASYDTFEVDIPKYLATMQPEVGAGFYAYEWGPLPFAFGRVPPARYHLLRIADSAVKK